MVDFIEPFRIKAVEPLSSPSREERDFALRAANYNLFRLTADQIMIDLLSDSGTGAMSSEQWAALCRGDETYAGARSFDRFEETCRQLTGCPHILPVHQGRAAERILFTSLLKPGQISLANTHFDSTRANVEIIGGKALEIPCRESLDLKSLAPFKGNIDLGRLEELLTAGTEGEIASVTLTATNNANGGQPV